MIEGIADDIGVIVPCLVVKIQIPTDAGQDNRQPSLDRVLFFFLKKKRCPRQKKKKLVIKIKIKIKTYKRIPWI